MEQREIEIGNIEKERRRKRKSASSSSLPMDLISEIFSKLPAKSVMRFLCVSKPCSSINTDPYFINMFETNRQISILFFFKECDKFFVFLIPQQHNQNWNESTSKPIDSYNIPYPKYCSFTIKSESVHGLICLQKSTTPIIWNPTMRKFLPLPKPGKSLRAITAFLGYDPIEGKHKVLCFPYDHNNKTRDDECRVLTLGSDQESWRSVEINHKHRPYSGTRHAGIYARCINGVLYYQANVDNYARETIIISFDVRSEKFDLIELPSWSQSLSLMKMKTYKGSLAFVDNYNKKDDITVWVLEDAKKKEWSKHVFPPPPPQYGGRWQKTYKLIGFSDDGELIYVPKTVLEAFDVIYIDPKRETLRRVRIADCEFRRSNGLGDKRIYGLQFFPYHIETLLSL